jgi:hypothetical protein
MKKTDPCGGCRTPSTCRKLKICPIEDSDYMDEELPEPEGLEEAISAAKATNPKDLAAVAKVSTSLVPEIALIELAQAFRDGARKYTPFNWRRAPVKTTVYLDAMERHLLLYRSGQDRASDSRLSHLTHIMSGCAILLDAELNGTLIDDRHKLPDPSKLERVLELYRQQNQNPQ